MLYAKTGTRIGQLACAMLLLGYGFDEILTEIEKEFPQAKTTRKCLSWYACHLRKTVAVPYFWCDGRR